MIRLTRLFMAVAAASLISPSFAGDTFSMRATTAVSAGIDASAVDEVDGNTDDGKSRKRGERAPLDPNRRRVVRRNDDDEDKPKTALEIARELGIAADDARPEQQRESTLFGKRLIVGGEVSTSLRGRGRYDLEDRDSADADAAAEGKLEAIWLPSERMAVFASSKAFGETSASQGRNTKRKSGITLDELWWLKTGLFETPLAIQVGRQRLRDQREWWWDDNMEAVRLHYFGSDLTGFVGAGRKLASLSTEGPLDAEDRGLFNVFGHLDWEWKKRHHLEVFALRQNDRSASYAVGDIVASDRVDARDADLTWAGVRARGCIKPKFPKRLCYWGDLARVSGREREFALDPFDANNDQVTGVGRRTVRGKAYDVGVSLELPFAPKPVLTLGRAHGSGDRSGTPGHDGAFRQTGLHRNDGRYRGLSRFRYYGEVLRPDLSNIEIDTAAIGIPLGDTFWLETIWHRYRQPEADNRIVGSPIDTNPEEDNDDLGEEIDVVLGYRPPTRWEFEMSGGAFRAGPAFGDSEGRWAGSVELKLDYNF